jgi:hypothetical protein
LNAYFEKKRIESVLFIFISLEKKASFSSY